MYIKQKISLNSAKPYKEKYPLLIKLWKIRIIKLLYLPLVMKHFHFSLVTRFCNKFTNMNRVNDLVMKYFLRYLPLGFGGVSLIVCKTLKGETKLLLQKK